MDQYLRCAVATCHRKGGSDRFHISNHFNVFIINIIYIRFNLYLCIYVCTNIMHNADCYYNFFSFMQDTASCTQQGRQRVPRNLVLRHYISIKTLLFPAYCRFCNRIAALQSEERKILNISFPRVGIKPTSCQSC